MTETGSLSVRLTGSEQDLLASQRLRYKVFVEELGASGPDADHARKLESDRFDVHFDHLLLVDSNRNQDTLEHVVGVYRLLRHDVAAEECGFYSASEFDLSPLVRSGRNLVELGRSCVHPDYRGGSAIFHLWNGLADYVLSHEIEIMFGVASFHGTDTTKLLNPLSYLHCRHLAPESLRVSSLQVNALPRRIPCDQVDVSAALRSIPPLLKSYLRLGGFVGEGVFVDHDFNTTDVCLILDTHRMMEGRRERYVRVRGAQ
ncbi:MAG: GNAT family N-acetyltransferase [Rhodobacteraceae bacterium]|nr:GNAT family N-acetyltransferase [Paracoccaceae bacterium]